jgi:thioesterase domain-containing protein
MDRRAFLGTLAGGLLAAPLAAEAQQAEEVHRIGLVDFSAPHTAR